MMIDFSFNSTPGYNLAVDSEMSFGSIFISNLILFFGGGPASSFEGKSLFCLLLKTIFVFSFVFPSFALCLLFWMNLIANSSFLH